MDDEEWEAVVTHTRHVLVSVAAERSTITYDALRHRLRADANVDVDARGDRDLAAVLRAVSVAADDAGEGLLSAVVVRRSGLPGGGWFRLAQERGRVITDRGSTWRTEVELVWSAFATTTAQQQTGA
jgi:hypothetical protein